MQLVRIVFEYWEENVLGIHVGTAAVQVEMLAFELGQVDAEELGRWGVGCLGVYHSWNFDL